MYSPRQVLARSVRVSVPSNLGSAPTDADIAAAERALGHVLPPAFVEFQRLLGGRTVTGLDVLRLATSSRASDLVESNLAWRSPRHGLALPADLVAFARDESGVLFCFDLRADRAEPPVVLWDSQSDVDENLRDLRPLHASFIAWLEAELDLAAAA